MAQQVKLVRRADFVADVESLSLVDYEDGFAIPRDGWNQAVSPDSQPVDEVISLRAKGASYDDLAGKIRNLDAFVEKANWYAAGGKGDPAERYGVWLRAQAEGETSYRQALLLYAERGKGLPLFSPPAAPGAVLKRYPLGLTRVGWWESGMLGPVPVGTLSSVGGMATVAASIGGDVPARITSIDFYGQGSVPAQSEIWAGFRSNRFGTVANLVRNWELNLASTKSSDTTTQTGDTSALNSNYVRCTFSSGAVMAMRVIIRVSDVTANYNDQRGRYLVLLRARVASSTSVRCRIGRAYYSAATWAMSGSVLITSTSWRYYPMGYVTLPPTRLALGDASLQESAIRIEAERLSGTNLDMDCLTLVPASEGFLHVSGANVVNPPDERARIMQDPNDEVVGYGFLVSTVAQPTRALATSPIAWGIPNSASSVSLVVAAQRSTAQDINDTLGVGLFYAQRYATLRGAG